MRERAAARERPHAAQRCPESICVARGSGSARAHPPRHGLQVVAAASCASVGGSPPAGANMSASLKRGALESIQPPAHCTARGALAHLGSACDSAQKSVIYFWKAGARRAGGAPPASENKRLWPGRGGRARNGGKNARGG